MARRKKSDIEAEQQAAAETSTPDTGFSHVIYKDINDDGIQEEIAVVKEWDDGSISYINVNELGTIDKSRLKKVLSSVHADKYPLFELLNQTNLSNGMNALVFFDQNMIRVWRPEGATASNLGGGLRNAKIIDEGSQMIGSDTSNPHEAITDGSPTGIM